MTMDRFRNESIRETNHGRCLLDKCIEADGDGLDILRGGTVGNDIGAAGKRRAKEEAHGCRDGGHKSG